jgi:hypothetical protein
VWCHCNFIKQVAGTDHRDVMTLLCQSMAGSRKNDEATRSYISSRK